ncbi:MAG: hypothetical protein HRU15_04665 [Planctomycetes bacterium]|nr:hypothetical protein [Planctomycetota bacterium]
MLGHYLPKKCQLWTGDIHQQRVSSSEEAVGVVDNTLQLISLQLHKGYDWRHDHLCLSFETQHGSREVVQVQMQQALAS